MSTNRITHCEVAEAIGDALVALRKTLVAGGFEPHEAAQISHSASITLFERATVEVKSEVAQ